MSHEAWLKSPDHEKFAAAAVKCQHAGAFCIQDGFCHNDGECFRSNLAALNAAIRAIQTAAENEPHDIAINMLDAVKWLRSQMEEARKLR